MVGLSPAELESLNELIHIDHVYFKPQPSAQFKDKQVVHTSEDIVHKVNSSESAVPQQHTQEVVLVTTSRSKRDSRGNIVSSKSPAPIVAAPTPCIIDSTDVEVGIIADDLVSSLSDSDMDSQLDLFQSLGFTDFLDEKDVIDLTSTGQTTIPCVKNHGGMSSNPQALNSSSSVDSSDIELDSQKLFDEIYDSYLSMKNSSSPDSNNLSDSGIGSDVGEALSPQYEESSLMDDYTWQDSFTDLFPDLQ